MKGTPSAVPVVLHPGLIALSFFEDPARRLMGLWRDGRIRLQMSHSLVVAVLELLAGLGLEPEDLRRWALWLCDSRRSDMHQLEASNPVAALRQLKEQGHRVLELDSGALATFIAEFD